jgi:hypothetical protein
VGRTGRAGAVLAALTVELACGPRVVIDEDETGSTGPDVTTTGPAGTNTATVTTDDSVGVTTEVPPGTTTVPPDPSGPFPGSTGPVGTDSTGDPFDPVGPVPVPDDEGDVILPSADVIAAAVYTDGALVDFRVQFAAPPFTDQATYDVTWCIESAPGGSGSCATHAMGVDAYLQLFQDGPAGEYVSGTDGVDACQHGFFDAGTNTLRILVPADVFPGTPDFRWILTVTYGGSGGANEWVPEVGDHPVTFIDELPPFDGAPSC